MTMENNYYAWSWAKAAPSGDIIRGADEIARFLFCETGSAARRRVYYAYENQHLPIFRSSPRGPYLARKEVLLRWIEQQEAAAKNRSARP